MRSFKEIIDKLVMVVVTVVKTVDRPVDNGLGNSGSVTREEVMGP